MSTTTTELPDDATSEQIHEYVDTLVENEGKTEDGGDDAGDETPDTETNETPSGEDEPDRDEPAGDEESAVSDDGEEAAQDDSQEDSWIDDDVRGLASAFGVTDEELSGFTGRDELERALALFDSRVMQAGDAPPAQQPGQEVQGESQTERHATDPNRRADGTFLPAEQRQAEQRQADQRQAEQKPFKLELDPEEYGEKLPGELGRLQEHYESQLQSLRQEVTEIRQTEQARADEVYTQQFDAAVDSLGQSELFGATGKETPQQMANRQKLEAEFQVRQELFGRSGRQIELGTPVLGYIARVAFSDHFFKQQRKDLTRKVSSQAALKMGSSVSKPNDPKPSVMEEMEELYKELEAQGE
jgi:hypothetical protein